ncbi:MAG: hypothetical protein ACJ71S_06120 [Acidobacteriaceae bacterium]|jgi:hypothetical protein
MGKLLKETTFFGGNRRKTELGSWQTLQTKAGEKHMKFAFEMVLSGEAVVAMPDWIADAFEAMAADDSALKRATIDRMLEGMTLDVFSTDKIKRRALSLTGVTIKNLFLTREGEDEKSEVFLHFTVYSPANVQARDWAWDTLRMTFWAAFEYSQSEMDFSGSADSDKAEGNEDEDNQNTMASERDAEFATPGTRKSRKPAAEAAVQ